MRTITPSASRTRTVTLSAFRIRIASRVVIPSERAFRTRRAFLSAFHLFPFIPIAFLVRHPPTRRHPGQRQLPRAHQCRRSPRSRRLGRPMTAPVVASRTRSVYTCPTLRRCPNCRPRSSPSENRRACPSRHLLRSPSRCPRISPRRCPRTRQRKHPPMLRRLALPMLPLIGQRCLRRRLLCRPLSPLESQHRGQHQARHPLLCRRMRRARSLRFALRLFPL